MKTQDFITKNLSNGFSFICYKDQYALCGQPQIEDLKEFKNSNWQAVLNLRNSEELESLDFELSDTCEQLGLEYNHIPIMKESEINGSALKETHHLLDSKPNKKTIIHCASGKRSILALIAHLYLSKKQTKEDLSELAEELGINSPQMLARLYESIETKK
ncbi:MAG: sulfur transferase domain-containing protein [Bdellovibrionaceae bacterium]|nr:sulfur transferase domain-containing protein [Pseudobdellovibrionaceae bacterium]